MTRSDWSDLIAAGIFSVAALAVIGAIVVLMAFFEARSYRKFCDSPVTTWDAVVLELRIDECAK